MADAGRAVGVRQGLKIEGSAERGAASVIEQEAAPHRSSNDFRPALTVAVFPETSQRRVSFGPTPSFSRTSLGTVVWFLTVMAIQVLRTRSAA